MPHTDTILQKIWRDFPESESIAFCKKEIKDLKFLVGVLTADYEEERDKRIEFEKILSKVDKEANTIKNLEAKIETYKEELAALRNKIIAYKGHINGYEKRIKELQELVYQSNKPRIKSNSHDRQTSI